MRSDFSLKKNTVPGNRIRGYEGAIVIILVLKQVMK